MSDNEELKTLKDVIKATSDYGYPEACNLSEEECNKLGLEFTEDRWNGTYSGEFVRNLLREEAKKWIESIQGGEFPFNREVSSGKGLCAKDLWDDSKFSYGMEYGLIWAFELFFNLNNENETN